jgi:hypothetical protein
MYEVVSPQPGVSTLVDTGLAQEYAAMHAFQDRRGNYLGKQDGTLLVTSPAVCAFLDGDIAEVSDSAYTADSSLVTSLPPHDILARISGVAKYDGIARDLSTDNHAQGSALTMEWLSNVAGVGLNQPIVPSARIYDGLFSQITGYAGDQPFRVETDGGGSIDFVDGTRRGNGMSPGMVFTVVDDSEVKADPVNDVWPSTTFYIKEVSGQVSEFEVEWVPGSVDVPFTDADYSAGLGGSPIVGYTGSEYLYFRKQTNAGTDVILLGNFAGDYRGDQVKVGDQYTLVETSILAPGETNARAIITVTRVSGESVVDKQWNTYEADNGEHYIPVPNRYMMNAYSSLQQIGPHYGSSNIPYDEFAYSPAITNARLPVNDIVPFPLTGYGRGWHVNATFEFNTNSTCHQELGFNIDNDTEWSASTLDTVGSSKYFHSTNPYSIWKRSTRLEHDESPEFSSDTFEIAPENEDDDTDRHFIYTTSSIVSDGVPFQLYPDMLYLYSDFNTNSTTSSGQHHRPNILTALPRVSTPGTLAVYNKDFFDKVYCNEITLDNLHIRVTDGRNRTLPLPDDNQQRGTTMVIKCYYSHKSKHLHK